MKGLQPLEVSEKGTVTFSVEVSHEDVEGTWQKDGVRLKPAPNVTMGVQGKKHSLTLSSVTLEDAGLISFKAEGIHSSGRLTVIGTACFGIWLSAPVPEYFKSTTSFLCNCREHYALSQQNIPQVSRGLL